MTGEGSTVSTSHALVLGLFESDAAAVSSARALRELGVARHRVSIVARSHALEGALAERSGASPGVELEDSLAAARVGELSAYLIAAVAVVLPGIGPIVAGGPLAAELSDAAGHLAGGLAASLQRAGLDASRAEGWASRVHRGAVLVGVHVAVVDVDAVEVSLTRHGASEGAHVSWPGELP